MIVTKNVPYSVTNTFRQQFVYIQINYLTCVSVNVFGRRRITGEDGCVVTEFNGTPTHISNVLPSAIKEVPSIVIPQITVSSRSVCCVLPRRGGSDEVDIFRNFEYGSTSIRSQFRITVLQLDVIGSVIQYNTILECFVHTNGQFFFNLS